MDEVVAEVVVEAEEAEGDVDVRHPKIKCPNLRPTLFNKPFFSTYNIL